MARPDLDALIELLNIKKKRDLIRYAKKLTITSEALCDLLLVGQVSALGNYSYANHHDEIRPEHLESTTAERYAFASNGVGPLSNLAAKHISKIDQLLKDRHLFFAHLFYSPTQKYWHLFYMDQRDYTNRDNHWIHGPHIHYSNERFTNEPLQLVWQKITSSPPSTPPKVHIRYDYHHNRRKSRHLTGLSNGCQHWPWPVLASAFGSGAAYLER